MIRRCHFLDKCPGFNYNTGSADYSRDASGKKDGNTNTKKLGSVLMRVMLTEVSNFCDPSVQVHKEHQQVG